MLRKFFNGKCIVEFALKVTARDYPWHIMDLYLLSYCNFTQQFERLKMERYKYRNLLDKWLDMTLFQNNTTNLRICFDGVMTENLGCDWVLLSYQRLKRWVDTILYIDSFDWFPIDMPKEIERVSDSSLSSFGNGSTIINLESSNDLSL